MSGKDERPIISIEACDLTAECRNLAAGEMYYNICDINYRIIGYINTRSAMKLGAYDNALQIHPRYETDINAFKKEIVYIRCQKCLCFYCADNLDTTRYKMFRRFIQYQIENDLYGYDE